MPGPVPKRSDERRRRNKEGGAVEKVDLGVLIAADVQVPEPNEDWHPLAYDWYMSLRSSGQSIFYEPAEWNLAVFVAEAMSRMLDPVPVVMTDSEGNQSIEMHEMPVKGADLNALTKVMGSLLITEADRRRLRLELEREKAKNALGVAGDNVVSITQNRQDLFKRDA